MRKFDLIVIGELNVDLIITGDDIVPEFGQREKLVDDVSLVAGSSSAIFACQAGKLGLRTLYIGKVGDDDFGRFMVRALAESGVDTSAIILDKSVKTGISVILSLGKDRSILTHLGSIAALRAEEIDLSILQQARHLHVASYFLQKGIQKDLPDIFAEAKVHGLTTSLDTNWDPDGRWDGILPKILEHVDVFLPNEDEIRYISGQADLEKAMAELARRIPIVVVKMGAAGAMAQTGDRVVRCEPLPVEVVDTTGAGDSFDAGFLYGYLNNLPLAESLQLGCICGALSTTKVGGTSGQPTLRELKKILEKFP